jgi:hypothetical protein
MKFITLFTALAVAIPAAFGLTVNTPTNVVECEPTQFQWSGGVAPYFLTLIPGGQPTASPIKQFAEQTGDSYTWTVDLGSGTSFTIALKDSTGTTAYSDIVTIMAGSSTSCLNNSVEETGTGGSGAASTPASGSTTAGSTAAATGATSPSSGSATSTASSSSSTQSSAAGRLSVSSAFGVAGVMGLVGAALF